MTLLTFSQGASLIFSGDEELGTIASAFAPPDSTTKSTLGSTPATSLVRKYTEDNL